MAVDQPRQHGPAIQVDDLSGRPEVAENLPLITHGKDTSLLDGDSLLDGSPADNSTSAATPALPALRAPLDANDAELCGRLAKEYKHVRGMSFAIQPREEASVHHRPSSPRCPAAWPEWRRRNQAAASAPERMETAPNKPVYSQPMWAAPRPPIEDPSIQRASRLGIVR